VDAHLDAAEHGRVLAARHLLHLTWFVEPKIKTVIGRRFHQPTWQQSSWTHLSNRHVSAAVKHPSAVCKNYLKSVQQKLCEV